MAVGLIVGGWFASAVIGKLVTVATSYLKDQYVWQMGMKKELKNLKESLPHIEAVVGVAESGLSGSHDPKLKDWLQQLKDAIYEADDVLDELEYLKLKEQVEAQKDRNKVSSYISASKKGIFKFTKRLFKRDPTLKRLRGVVKRLDQVAAGVGTFLTLVERTRQQQQEQAEIMSRSRETGPLSTERKVFGRVQETEQIIEWLGKSVNDDDYESAHGNVSLLSVVGIGGVGKTTLARLVYEAKIAEEFELKMWVCVSNNFDAKKLIKDILESSTKRRPEVDGLPALQDILKEKLTSSKKFLLVLDDVWNDEKKSEWGKLLAPLKCGQKGSKILLTTRMDSVADLVAKVMDRRKEALYLKGLEKKDYLSLFNRYAFDGKNPEDYKGLQSIGEKIAARLGGSPLAAKTMGGLLNSNLDARHWTNILHRSISDLGQSEDDIMPVLRLSYHHLPVHLQGCFAYISIFPQDHKFDKSDLVRMWIAAGLIQQSPNRNETPEDVGGNYFNDLVKKSFFDQLSQYGSTGRYTIHDLLHELAQLASAGECFRVADDEVGKIPETVRHLSVVTDSPDLLKEIGKFKNVHQLHTLHLSFCTYGHELDNTFNEVLKGLKSIRVLHLQAADVAGDIKVFPAAIGDLIHLRYLNLGSINITRLPESLSRLYLLQVLIFFGDLPEGMNSLISLRHLILHQEAIQKIAGIGKLTSLQELNKFRVTLESGHKIAELKKMRELRELTISDLKNVQSYEEARQAKLNEKKYLSKLKLEWNLNNFAARNNSHELDEQVIDSLQPCSDLKELRIKGYRGLRYACWMKPEVISNLEYIEFLDCSGWEHLPPLGQLPLLKFLLLEQMPALRKVDRDFCMTGNVGGFQSLEVLKFDSLENWERWSGGEEDGQWFPRLHKFIIRNCPKLKALPFLPPGLTELEIYNVGLEEWVRWSGGVESVPCLHKLTIKYCPKLKLLPSLPLTLTMLEINEVGLKEWKGWIEGSEASPCLCSLNISACPWLKVLPSLPLSLEELTI